MMTALQERERLHEQNRLEQWRTSIQRHLQAWHDLNSTLSPPTDQEADGLDDIILEFAFDFDSLEDYMNITSRGGSDLSFTGPPDCFSRQICF